MRMSWLRSSAADSQRRGPTTGTQVVGIVAELTSACLTISESTIQITLTVP
jgi:hypothetical protein